MIKRRKTLQELTFKDNFMFAAVMLDEENAKGVIERALDIQVDHVEMQVANTEIFKRSRYYHSQIDMELLSTGIDYEQLPESYVIFICDFDPIGLGKYKYTRRQIIEEERDYIYDDGSKNDYSDEFVKRLQKSVEKIKFDKEIGRRYMLFEELMKEEYNAGKVEGARSIIIELLCEIAPISDNLKERISSIKDLEDIMQLSVKAARLDSLEDFEKELEKMGY